MSKQQRLGVTCERYLNVVGEGDVVDPLAGRGVQIHLAIDAGVVVCIIATKMVPWTSVVVR